jgi:tetratricopeptide (TPR) repeat protein
MSNHHPTVEDLDGFLRNTFRAGSASRNTRVLRHLLSGCGSCWTQLRVRGWGGKRLDRLLYLPGAGPLLEEEAPTANGCSYDSTFAQVEEGLAAFLAEESPLESSLEELWAEIMSCSAEDQGRRVTEARFAHPRVVQKLIDQSHAARYEDPAGMLHLADLARQAAEACSVEAAGSAPRLADLRTRAWGHFGNSLRVCGRIQEAGEALETARHYREEGTGDPPLRARLLEQMASLQIFQRQFAAAIELADEAGEVYRELGETHLLASSLVHKAIAYLYAGEPQPAVRVLNQAIPLIDHEVDPHLLLAACHNLVRCYIDLDRPDQALALYFETRDLYKEFADSLIQLRASWQEGQLLRDLGHLRTAETALLQARKGFMDRNLPYEVAVVSLDLAAVYIKLKVIESVKQTVVETVPIFRALRVDRDALASLLQLQQVADQEHQALNLIRTLTSRLEQHHRQTLR